MKDDLAATEAANPLTTGLDELQPDAVVEILVREQRKSVDAVAACSAQLGAAVEAIARRIESGGRLHYAGAGTSGRLAVLDASEMPPTFGTPRDLVCAHIAGGDSALRTAVEGAEDDAAAGLAAMHHVAGGDAVIGLSASGGAPFVVAALKAAREVGAYTLAIVNTEPSALADAAESTIVLRTGAEPLTGSTRLLAGTSQKIALNALSTALMVRLGKVHGNLMVDVVATNRKLRARARRLVEQLAGVDRSQAQALLDAAEGRVKVAVVMSRRSLDAASAAQLLAAHRGILREVL